MNARRLALTLGVAIGLLGSGSVAALQEATPGASPAGPSPPEGCTVIASGLVNPRYVAVAEDGTIYVSEAGVGGDEVFAASVDAAATPAPAAEAGPPGTRGTTGQVTMIAPDGTQSVFVENLPSYATGFDIVGPAGIAVADNGQIVLAVGGAGRATGVVEPIPNENSVLSIDPETGDALLLANIGAYEIANNPDGFAVDSNLYGVEVGDDGTVYVNDAGGNATYRIPPGGDPEVVAVYEGLPLAEGMEAPPGGNPDRGGALELDPVPTDVVGIAEGRLLVGLLSGGSFPPGAAKVLSVAADGAVNDLVTGLTMVVGLAIGPDNQLYASQLSTNFLGEMPEPGNVVRLLADGTEEVIVDGLVLPNGITFDQNGNLLVVTNTVSPGEPNDQLLRCEGVGAAADAPEEEVVALNDVFFRSR